MKKYNNWHVFSRGLCVALLTIAAFCGICGFGAAFNQVPWLMIAGGICLLLLIFTAVWFLGYKSKKANQPEAPVEVIVEKVPNNQDDVETYRVRRNAIFDYDVGAEVPIPDSSDVVDAEN